MSNHPFRCNLGHIKFPDNEAIRVSKEGKKMFNELKT